MISVSFVFAAINRTIEQLKSEGLPCKGYVVDISKRENVVEAAKIIKDEIGNVDILINNAGIVCCKPFWDLSEKMIENTYAVNILSHYWVNSVFMHQLDPENLFPVLLFTDGQSIPSRDDGIESWPYRDSCIRGRFARHIRLHRLQCHEIRLRWIP